MAGKWLVCVVDCRAPVLRRELSLGAALGGNYVEATPLVGILATLLATKVQDLLHRAYVVACGNARLNSFLVNGVGGRGWPFLLRAWNSGL